MRQSRRRLLHRQDAHSHTKAERVLMIQRLGLSLVGTGLSVTGQSCAGHPCLDCHKMPVRVRRQAHVPDLTRMARPWHGYHAEALIVLVRPNKHGGVQPCPGQPYHLADGMNPCPRRLALGRRGEQGQAPVPRVRAVRLPVRSLREGPRLRFPEKALDCSGRLK